MSVARRPLDDEPDRTIVKRAKSARGDVVDRRPVEPEEDNDLPLAEDIERFGDVTMKCHECGAELFDDVGMCWNCGAAVGPGARETKTSAWVVVVTGLVVGGIVLVFVLQLL